MHCVAKGWMCILVGPPATGKTSLVRLLAAMTGNPLREFSLSSATDTTELLGCFEQHDLFRQWQEIVRGANDSLKTVCSYCLSLPEGTHFRCDGSFVHKESCICTTSSSLIGTTGGYKGSEGGAAACHYPLCRG